MKVMELTLLVMAAGVGSRYGGLKQLDTFGPNNEAILDYSVYDALKSGFSKVVFVIRKDIEEAFRSTILKRISPHIATDCVYQELDSCVPKHISISKDRKKPWGTGHAVLVAKTKIKGPFAVINADDFYGRASFKAMADFLRNNSGNNALVAYQLKKTLSNHGSVSRGICNIDSLGYLQSVTEHTKIAKDSEGHLIDWQPNGTFVRLTGNERVSLNLWGLQASFFDYFNKQFHDFLELKAQDRNAEFYLPAVIDAAINDNFGTIAVLPTTENWFGVTYKEDIEIVRSEIQQKINSNEYPSNLWS